MTYSMKEMSSLALDAAADLRRYDAGLIDKIPALEKLVSFVYEMEADGHLQINEAGHLQINEAEKYLAVSNAAEKTYKESSPDFIYTKFQTYKDVIPKKGDETRRLVEFCSMLHRDYSSSYRKLI